MTVNCKFTLLLSRILVIRILSWKFLKSVVTLSWQHSLVMKRAEWVNGFFLQYWWYVRCLWQLLNCWLQQYHLHAENLASLFGAFPSSVMLSSPWSFWLCLFFIVLIVVIVWSHNYAVVCRQYSRLSCVVLLDRTLHPDSFLSTQEWKWCAVIYVGK